MSMMNKKITIRPEEYKDYKCALPEKIDSKTLQKTE